MNEPYWTLIFPWKWPLCLNTGHPIGMAAFWAIFKDMPGGYITVLVIECAIVYEAILFLAWALKRTGMTTGMVWSIVVPLAWTPMFMRNYAIDFAEPMAGAFGVATVASLLMGWDVAGGLFAFVACMFRPQMLILVPLMVILRRSWKAALCVTLPILAYCSLRLFAVGDFALVPGGAYQASGITALIVQPGDVNKLQGKQKELARYLLSKPLIKQSGWYESGSTERYMTRWFNSNERIYLVRCWGDRNFSTISEGNRFVSKFNWSMIRLHPFDYLETVARNLLSSAQKIPGHGTVPMLVAILIFSLFWRVMTWGPMSYACYDAMHFAWIATLWFVLSDLLLAFVAYPVDRYLSVPYLFVPSALCCLIYSNWRIER